jgi:site-specific DNA-methyltransferase (adenine-specific)
MAKLADHSVDLLLVDLPYGTTACPWDSVIPLDRLWKEYYRIMKPNKAMVFTASQPFTTSLIASNIKDFKYEWIWVKNRPTNFAHAKNKPMKKHENVLVFSTGTTVHASQSASRMPYNPQGLIDIEEKTVVKKASEKTDVMFSERPGHGEFKRNKTGYPHSILEFSTDQLGIHPTAKPVALFEYLIRTYSEEGDLVLDNTAGSGTTAIAAINTNRKWICIEKDEDYYSKAIDRVQQHSADKSVAVQAG